MILCLLLLFPIGAHGAEPADSVAIVRSVIGEASASFWSDSEIETWLDQGISDISARGLVIQTADSFLLVTGQLEYTDLVSGGSSGATDIVKMWGAIYISPDNEYVGLKRIYPSQIADLPFMAAGPPKYFYKFADRIGILPLPTTSENAQSVKIYFSKQPAAASLALRIAELPPEFTNLIYNYCASFCYKKEHRFTESDKFYQMYLAELNALKKELYDVPSEIPPK